MITIDIQSPFIWFLAGMVSWGLTAYVWPEIFARKQFFIIFAGVGPIGFVLWLLTIMVKKG